MFRKRRTPTRFVPLTHADEICKSQACKGLIRGFQVTTGRLGHPLPAFTDMELFDFRYAVSNLVLASVSLRGGCVYLLVGERLRTRWGFDLVGWSHYDLVEDQQKGWAKAVIDMVVAVPCGVRVEVEQTFADGRVLRAETLVLPLQPRRCGEDGQVVFTDKILNVLDNTVANVGHPLRTKVLEHDLVDIGFGVDASFCDHAPTHQPLRLSDQDRAVNTDLNIRRALGPARPRVY